jgi:hypothetical protein
MDPLRTCARRQRLRRCRHPHEVNVLARRSHSIERLENRFETLPRLGTTDEEHDASELRGPRIGFCALERGDVHAVGNDERIDRHIAAHELARFGRRGRRGVQSSRGSTQERRGYGIRPETLRGGMEGPDDPRTLGASKHREEPGREERLV